MLRVGILDPETEYVGKLAAYLNRVNQGAIECSAFTKKDKLMECMKEHHMEVVVSTDEELLMGLQELHQKVCYIWLTDGKREKNRFHQINRYQSGVQIAKEMNQILYCDGLYLVKEHPMVAVYSPIGRCGKTQMILHYIKEQQERRWLYIGLEDYGTVAGSGKIDWLYFVKERREEKLVELMEQSNGIIESPFSPFDAKTLQYEDMEWLLQLLKREKGYHGTIFDIGTGILQDIHCLTLFDQVILPYLKEEISLKKKEKFEQLSVAYGLGSWLEKIHFLDMKEHTGLSKILDQ